SCVPVKNGYFIAIPSIPQTGSAIVGCCHNALTIGREGRAPQHACVSFQDNQLLEPLGSPEQSDLRLLRQRSLYTVACVRQCFEGEQHGGACVPVAAILVCEIGEGAGLREPRLLRRL